MKKVLVTGGAGFIGSHTVIELVAMGYQPVIADNFSNSDRRVTYGLTRILGTVPETVVVDCTDSSAMRQLFTDHGFHAVIHFAAFKAVGESVAHPLKYYRNNLLSTQVVLECMEEFGVKHLVFSSSCTVYGQPDQLPVTESTPLKTPASPYGFTKQVCERMVSDFVAASGVHSAALLRYFNPVGAHRSGFNGELPYGVPNNLVPYITQVAAGVRKSITVFGDDYNTPDGTCIRDYIHVTDLARAHVKTLDWLEANTGKCEAFNLGQGRGHSVLEVIRTFEEVTGNTLPVIHGPRRSGDVEQIWAEVSKANRELNWHTELSLEEALSDAWRWQCNLGAIQP
ncbi:MAG: UDP-glucose 4-epimerase GalE [Flavobacteriales bacterium]|nr:UDP-glucose 4-epimerase GalE [Flavobacteriales bacterium]